MKIIKQKTLGEISPISHYTGGPWIIRRPPILETAPKKALACLSLGIGGLGGSGAGLRKWPPVKVTGGKNCNASPFFWPWLLPLFLLLSLSPFLLSSVSLSLPFSVFLLLGFRRMLRQEPRDVWDVRGCEISWSVGMFVRFFFFFRGGWSKDAQGLFGVRSTRRFQYAEIRGALRSVLECWCCAGVLRCVEYWGIYSRVFDLWYKIRYKAGKTSRPWILRRFCVPLPSSRHFFVTVLFVCHFSHVWGGTHANAIVCCIESWCVTMLLCYALWRPPRLD